MNKYLLKYIIPNYLPEPDKILTKFFNTVDIEQEWINFTKEKQNFGCQLIDITYLGKCHDYN